MHRSRILLALLALVTLAEGCGRILGDQDPGVLITLACTLVVGVAIGYGVFRWGQHGWRTHRRDRREERREDRPPS